MYESYFDLEVKPFELLPNPEFIYLSKSHKRAMTYLDYGIRERAGFILLTGEIGSGKTTLIRDLIKKHHDDMVLSKVFNTNVDSQELLSLIVEDFGVSVQGKDKFTLFRDLNDFLVDQYAHGGRPVVIIDEAQNLAPEQLEEIRMLSNLETDTGKLLQIILVGQPELRKTLSSPRLVQLRQRISINCHLQPLSSSEIYDYILHRLHTAGNREALSFAPEALETIYKYSRGIPRLINIICDFLLLAAFAEEVKHVGGEMVKEIIGDLDFDNHYWGDTEAGDVPAAAANVPVHCSCEPALGEIKTLLIGLCTRMDHLEQQKAADSSELERTRRHLDEYQRRFMEETPLQQQPTAGSIDAEVVPVIEPSKGEGTGGKDDDTKTGILGRLFRAV